jgi:hypothetical protein
MGSGQEQIRRVDAGVLMRENSKAGSRDRSAVVLAEIDGHAQQSIFVVFQVFDLNGKYSASSSIGSTVTFEITKDGMDISHCDETVIDYRVSRRFHLQVYSPRLVDSVK